MQDLATAEVTGAAADLFLYWLDGAGPGARPDGDAVDLGLELVLQLSEASDVDLVELVLARLHEIRRARAFSRS